MGKAGLEKDRGIQESRIRTREKEENAIRLGSEHKTKIGTQKKCLFQGGLKQG